MLKCKAEGTIIFLLCFLTFYKRKMKDDVNFLKEFMVRFDSMWFKHWVRHYIANYIWWNIAKVECILTWIIIEGNWEKLKLQETVENIKKIELLLLDKDFTEKLEAAHKKWNFDMQELLNLLNNK